MAQKQFEYNELTNGAITLQELQEKISEAADSKINPNILKEYLTEKNLMVTIRNKTNNLTMLGITPNGYEHGLRLSTGYRINQDGTSVAYPTITFPEKVTSKILEDTDVLAERTEKHKIDMLVKNTQKRYERRNRNADKPWTENEIKSIIGLHKTGRSAAQIANIICRPYAEVDQLMTTLNIAEK